MIERLFPRTSSFFDKPAEPDKELVVGRTVYESTGDREPKLPLKKLSTVSGPTTAELEHWYRVLNDSVEIFGDTRHGDILTDLRDEIYRYLR